MNICKQTRSDTFFIALALSQYFIAIRTLNSIILYDGNVDKIQFHSIMSISLGKPKYPIDFVCPSRTDLVGSNKDRRK